MALSAADLAALLDRARSAAATTGLPADRAAAIAGVLHAAWPAAAVACRLEDAAGTAIAALDKSGRPQPDLAAELRDRLAGGETDFAIRGMSVHIAALENNGRKHGELATTFDDTPHVLTAIARATASVLDHAALADELVDRDWLADLGEIVGPVTHEFNNFLNTLMLQLAVIEMSASEALKGELQGLKRQAKQVAGVVKLLQQYRRQRAGDPSPADLSRAAEAAAQDVERKSSRSDAGPRLRLADAPGPEEVPLRMQLRPGLPLVPGPAADLRRLCRFLLGGTAWTVAGGGSLLLTTAATESGAALRVEAVGASGGTLARLLEGCGGGNGTQGLELAACQSLVRRLGGSIRAEPLPDGEAMVVELPAAAH
jgi:signal transduction histidine kinase